MWWLVFLVFFCVVVQYLRMTNVRVQAAETIVRVLFSCTVQYCRGRLQSCEQIEMKPVLDDSKPVMEGADVSGFLRQRFQPTETIPRFEEIDDIEEDVMTMGRD